MKIIRKKTILGCAATLPSLILLAALAGGCAATEVSDTGLAEETDGLHLRLSIETAGYSRAGDVADDMTAAAERRIDNVLVMLFEPGDEGRPGALLMSKTAENLTADAGEGVARRFDVKMSLSSKTDFPDRFRLVALANGAHLASQIEDMRGKAYSVIRDDLSLWRDEKGEDSGALFTMWGSAKDPVEKNVRVQNVGMRLLRDMAKITVSLPLDADGNHSVEGDNGFLLAHALVYNRRGDVSILPDMAALDSPDGSGAGKYPYGVKAPSVKKDVNEKTLLADLRKDDGYEGELSSTGLTSISLYVPEQDILMGEDASIDDDNAMQRPALIVGGYNGGDTGKLSWYRVDFTGDSDAEGNARLCDILRNHHYRVSVKAVNGPGEETPELAYGTLQTKVDTDIVDWTEVEWDAEFDGANWIAAQREVSVGASAGDIAEIILRSNIPAGDWTFTWGEEDKDLFEASISNESNEADESDRTKVIIKALQDLPAEVESRTAVLTVNVTAKLRFVINVIQTRGETGGDSDDAHDPWKDDYLNWIFS